MPLDPDFLRRLTDRGWHFTRDGSTATARLVREHADDPESGWEVLVLVTAGHPPRWSLEALDSGLTERDPPEARLLSADLDDALLLLERWRGELPEDPPSQAAGSGDARPAHPPARPRRVTGRGG